MARKFNNTLHMNVLCSQPLQMDTISEEFVLTKAAADQPPTSMDRAGGEKPNKASGTSVEPIKVKIDGIAVYPTPLERTAVKVDGIAVYPTPMEDSQATTDVFQKSGRKSKCFFLKNVTNDLVLGMELNGDAAAAKVLRLAPKKGAHEFVNNQLFYEHPQTGTLRCVMNDLCLEASGKSSLYSPLLMR